MLWDADKPVGLSFEGGGGTASRGTLIDADLFKLPLKEFVLAIMVILDVAGFNSPTELLCELGLDDGFSSEAETPKPDEDFLSSSTEPEFALSTSEFFKLKAAPDDHLLDSEMEVPLEFDSPEISSSATEAKSATLIEG